MKKLINAPGRVVPEMLAGLVATGPGLALLEGETVVVRRGAPLAEEVALISGGGSGHEPAHAGYVGPGLLTAAVAGDVFTSPSTDAVLAAIRAAAGPAGALLIVKNYTGDRLNFGLAAELARAEGIPVETVVVADDVALSAADGSHAGRRGLAGTVLIHKIAGAAAARRLKLAEVKRIAEAAIAELGTMGVALSACTVPAAGRPGFTLGEDEVELGLGIHGEPGVRRAPIGTADALVDELLGRIAGDLRLGSGDTVALLVNGLGGTPAMELAIVTRAALAWLGQRGITVARAWTGSFLTALEMAGCSLSLLRVDPERIALLDADAHAPAWPGSPGAEAALDRAPMAVRGGAARSGSGRAGPLGAPLEAVCAALRREEQRLTALDQAVGDGDLGISLARGAEALERDRATYDLADPAAALRAMSATLARALGGTSGPLYAAALLRAATTMSTARAFDPAAWAAALSAGAAAIAELGGAGRGDRTMLDALLPAAASLQAALEGGASPREALSRATAAAQEGADATASMLPRRGRSSYLGERAVGHPDPGAVAVAVWLAALRDSL